MERTPITDITSAPVRLALADQNDPKQLKYFQRGQVLIKRGKKIIGCFSMVDLFDGQGNYFET